MTNQSNDKIVIDRIKGDLEAYMRDEKSIFGDVIADMQKPDQCGEGYIAGDVIAKTQRHPVDYYSSLVQVMPDLRKPGMHFVEFGGSRYAVIAGSAEEADAAIQRALNARKLRRMRCK